MRDSPAHSESDYPDALVRDACGGDRRAFGELFRLLYPRVHRTVWAMLGSEQEAHDVAQTAWIKAWEKRSAFNFQSLYSTWVHRIAINCALDALRRRRSLRNRFVSLFDSTRPDPVDPPAAAAGSGPAELARAELGQLIEAAVDGLPDDQRTVLVLREYEGYSYAEISKALRIPPGTVMSRLHLARQKLQSRLSKDLS